MAGIQYELRTCDVDHDRRARPPFQWTLLALIRTFAGGSAWLHYRLFARFAGNWHCWMSQTLSRYRRRRSRLPRTDAHGAPFARRPDGPGPRAIHRTFPTQ